MARNPSGAARDDRDRRARRRAEHRLGVAAADREREVPVGVLVQDDVARPRIRERARGDGVVPLVPDRELDWAPGLDAGAGDLLATQVELDVPEAVGVDDDGVDAAALLDARLRK